MRVFKDLDMVEQLGSGVPRILRHYPQECFKFTDNFLRMSFPKSIKENTTTQVTPQVEKLLSVLKGEMSRVEIQENLNLSDKKNFVMNYLQPALELGLIEMTIPDKPNSRLQRYRKTN